jgi:hypothetical protein
MIAIAIPMQTGGPAANGWYANLWRLATFSGRKWSG